MKLSTIVASAPGVASPSSARSSSDGASLPDFGSMLGDVTTSAPASPAKAATGVQPAADLRGLAALAVDRTGAVTRAPKPPSDGRPAALLQALARGFTGATATKSDQDDVDLPEPGAGRAQRKRSGDDEDHAPGVAAGAVAGLAVPTEVTGLVAAAALNAPIVACPAGQGASSPVADDSSGEPAPAPTPPREAAPLGPVAALPIADSIVPGSVRVETHLGFGAAAPTSPVPEADPAPAGIGTATGARPLVTAESSEPHAASSHDAGTATSSPATVAFPQSSAVLARSGPPAASTAVAVSGGGPPAVVRASPALAPSGRRVAPADADVPPSGVADDARWQANAPAALLAEGADTTNHERSAPDSRLRVMPGVEPAAPATPDGGDIEPQAVASAVMITPAPIGAPALVRQVAEAVASLAADPRQEENGTKMAPARSMALQLAPAGLGTLTVHLRLSGRSLDLRLDASDGRTAALIDRDRDALSDALGGEDLTLQSLTITSHDATMPGDPHAERGADPRSADPRTPDQPRDGGSPGHRAGGHDSGRGAREAPNRGAPPARRPKDESAVQRGGDGLFV